MDLLQGCHWSSNEICLLLLNLGIWLFLLLFPIKVCDRFLLSLCHLLSCSLICALPHKLHKVLILWHSKLAEYWWNCTIWMSLGLLVLSHHGCVVVVTCLRMLSYWHLFRWSRVCWGLGGIKWSLSWTFPLLFWMLCCILLSIQILCSFSGVSGLGT